MTQRAYKQLLLMLSLVAGFALTACGNDDEPQIETIDFPAGEIPGLGGTEGELTGTPFSLPEGVSLVGDINGAGNMDGYWDFTSTRTVAFTEKDGTVTTQTITPRPLTRTDETVLKGHFGSGKGYVDLLIPMHNSRTTPVTVTFPAGLILQNVAGDTQNGVLIKKVTVTIPAGVDYNLNLAFYCGNASKGSAHSGDYFTLGVVSNAAPLIELCNMVKNKKINIEEFDRTSTEEHSTFVNQCNKLQGIVWEVTDYDGLDEDDIAYINSLPNSR